jgi:molecular chaperone DnaK (HSP70)
MRSKLVPLALGGILMLGVFAGNNVALAQNPGGHGPRTIDQELDHLTKDLELTRAQQKEVKPLLLEHHQKIQELLDKNPSVSREALSKQIHAISDETHQEIHRLLTDHQKQLEKAMRSRMHNELGNGEGQTSSKPTT